MVYDAHSTTSGSDSAVFGLDDVPPSYDSISDEYNQPPPEGYGSGGASGSGAGPSSSGSSEPWPANMKNLFVGPPNAEVLPSREASLPAIATKKSWWGGLDSWDPKLANPETLYEFIRGETLKPPAVKIRCLATHSETVQTQTTTIVDGQVRTLNAGQTQIVTDFDFTIDLSPVYDHPNNSNNVHLMARAAHVPVYRGTHARTYGGAYGAGREASRGELRTWDAWAKFAAAHARAPWSAVGKDSEFWLGHSGASEGGIRLGAGGARGEDEEALISGNTEEGNVSLREWCDAYCADPGLLKSFVLHKTVWGWDMATLRKAIENAILSTGYQPSGRDIQITVSSPDETLTVRPDNLLVKATCTPFWYIFLWITLLYPLIWLWQRRSPRGGAPYEVAQVTYAMKFYPPLPGTFPNESIEQARHRLASLFKLHPEVPKNPLLQRGPKGVHYLLGRREGEWFRAWEEAIRMGVRMRYAGELQMYRIDEDEDPPQLDGY